MIGVVTCTLCREEFPGPGLQCDGCRGLPRDGSPAIGVGPPSLVVPVATVPPSRPRPKSLDPRASMTRVEMRMADVLDLRVRQGEVSSWWFEHIVFKTGADRTTYRPDFVALLPDGSLEIIETKGGHIWEDARKSFKAAAAMYPFARWRMLQWVDDEWRTVYDFNHERAGR